ncbi:lactonase family protein [Bacillus sp. 165]|nr:lactonase family protein [Bacillus sp. 165]MBO9130993.1 lactonase family protein [Bacillus sp. 165]
MTNNKFIGYVGTYTKENSKGIYTFILDTEAAAIKDVKIAAELENPTYVTITENNKYLYSVLKAGQDGGVASYSINEETGELTLLNNQLLPGASPCHVSVSKNNKHILSANYHKGTIEAYSAEVTGHLNPVSSSIQHEGHGPNSERQEKPHTHFSGFTPDEKYIVAVDLGIDKLITYQLNNGMLTKVSSLSVKAGSGPRHIAFHPNGTIAYVITELSSEVITLKYDSENGTFTELQYISTIPVDFTTNNQCSAIHVSADGRFVYAANRGHNTIAIYSADANTGELTFIEHTSTEGNWPRDFVLDPTEAYIIASNEKSHNLVLYSRDASTGKLTLLQCDVTVPEPVCVKFLHA